MSPRKRSTLGAIIADFNARFGTNHRIEEFDRYCQDAHNRKPADVAIVARLPANETFLSVCHGGKGS